MHSRIEEIERRRCRRRSTRRGARAVRRSFRPSWCPTAASRAGARRRCRHFPLSPSSQVPEVAMQPDRFTSSRRRRWPRRRLAQEPNPQVMPVHLLAPARREGGARLARRCCRSSASSVCTMALAAEVDRALADLRERARRSHAALGELTSAQRGRGEARSLPTSTSRPSTCCLPWRPRRGPAGRCARRASRERLLQALARCAARTA